MLSKAQILAASDVKTQSVSVPEWGGVVNVRSLKGWERDQFDESQMNAKSVVHYRAKLVAKALCDESGNSLGFTDGEILQLSEKNAAALDRVFDAARKLSGIGADAKEVENIEKNSPGQNESSG